MGLQEAQDALNRARKQWERVSAAWPLEDYETAVTWAFYAYENCVVAAAEAQGIAWRKLHYNKVAIARQLYENGQVRRDIGDELERLNELRKDVQYGGPGLELLEVDLEYLVIELETFVEEVAALLVSADDR